MKKVFEKIATFISILLNNKVLRKPDFSEKKIFLSGKILAEQNEKKIKINSLKDVEFSVFSQFGEDGILCWLTSRLPQIPKIFLEIGTQDYWESNTRFLLKLKNWKGFLIEGSKTDINKIKSQRIYWQHKLKAIHAFVNKDNINQLIKDNLNEKDIGLLSIDIDGNDYWILEKLEEISPAIVVCEYNSIFGDLRKLTVPYDENFIRNTKHYSNLYFGCSIKALKNLMDYKGYFFIGTSCSGVNAFFVKNEFKFSILENLKNVDAHPSLSREARNQEGKLTFEDNTQSLKKIEDLEIFDLELNKINKIKDYRDLYSSEWKSKFN